MIREQEEISRQQQIYQLEQRSNLTEIISWEKGSSQKIFSNSSGSISGINPPDLSRKCCDRRCPSSSRNLQLICYFWGKVFLSALVPIVRQSQSVTVSCFLTDGVEYYHTFWIMCIINFCIKTLNVKYNFYFILINWSDKYYNLFRQKNLSHSMIRNQVISVSSGMLSLIPYRPFLCDFHLLYCSN